MNSERLRLLDGGGGGKALKDSMQETSRNNSMTEPAQPPNGVDATGTPDGRELRGRREFLGKSGKLLIYVPPAIQLFIPTKALAASPSS